MRVLACMAAMLFSFSSFASGFYNHYEGGGVWKDLAGNRGVFTESIDKTPISDSSFMIVGAVRVGEMTHTWTSVVDMNSDGTFFVKDGNNAIIGSGYCFVDTCHMEIQEGTFITEETFHFSGANLHIMGSKTMSGGKVMYKGDLVGSHHAEQQESNQQQK